MGWLIAARLAGSFHARAERCTFLWFDLGNSGGVVPVFRVLRRGDPNHAIAKVAAEVVRRGEQRQGRAEVNVLVVRGDRQVRITHVRGVQKDRQIVRLLKVRYRIDQWDLDELDRRGTSQFAGYPRTIANRGAGAALGVECRPFPRGQTAGSARAGH